ncbi:MAG TPA: IS1595 family transposase [Bacteroidia bacterium]|nr:IS1595 family transposase [Bacteroidia bacterium]
MEKSKMPIQNWFIIFHLMTSVKKSFSAKEIQKQLERNRYEPVWLLMQKIRIAMGKADARYQLVGDIEIDDAHYEVVLDKKTRLRQPKTWSRQLKRGKGSERQAKVVVMVESRPNPFNKNKHRPSKSLGRIKMATIDHFKYQEINYEVEKAINQEAVILSDGLAGFKRLNEVVSKHVTATVMPTESSKVFPWVNTTISNSKRLLLGTHHSIGKLFLQNYLNEFCYKLNRRNHYIDLFDLLLDDAISMRWNS